MPVFEVLIVEHPTPKKVKDGALECVVFGPKFIVAKDDKGAGLSVLLDYGEKIKADRQRLEVLIRPFK